ncbi:MAG: sensor histidine kinase, partial [Clostridia bacterium]|nr:sensor histidine kinase [Clostridia bacterium]
MIKILQKRFVATAMIAVALLLTVLIGGINVANTVITEQQTDRLLDFLLISEAKPRRDAFPREQRGFIAPPFNEDTRMSSVHFTAVVGESTSVDVSRIGTVDEEKALEYVNRAIAKGESDGKVERFRFRTTERGEKTVYVFLDTSSQSYAIWRMAILSMLCGAVVFMLMLLLVILLSKKAIQPIAANIERQKQFVTDAGHELKTPIAIILANAEAMELHTGESKWSKNIREQATRLSSLTQNLLALSRADEAQYKS